MKVQVMGEIRASLNWPRVPIWLATACSLTKLFLICFHSVRNHSNTFFGFNFNLLPPFANLKFPRHFQVGLHLRDRQGPQALHFPAQGRRSQAHHRRGEGQASHHPLNIFDRIKLQKIKVGRIFCSLCMRFNESNLNFSFLHNKVGIKTGKKC